MSSWLARCCGLTFNVDCGGGTETESFVYTILSDNSFENLWWCYCDLKDKKGDIAEYLFDTVLSADKFA